MVKLINQINGRLLPIKLNNFTVSLSQTGYEISSNLTPFDVYDHLHISWTVAKTSIFTDDKHTFWFDTYL